MSPNDKPAGHPVRRCASCRTRREASHLVRLVASEDGEVRVDLERRISGRGLNLCPSPDCFHDALRKNLFRRSLSVTERCDQMGRGHEVLRVDYLLAEDASSQQPEKALGARIDRSEPTVMDGA